MVIRVVNFFQLENYNTNVLLRFVKKFLRSGISLPTVIKETEVFHFLKITACCEFSNKAILSSSTGDKSGD